MTQRNGNLRVAEPHIEAPVSPQTADAYCPRLWDDVEITAPGTIRPCCMFDGAIQDRGRPASIYDRGLDSYLTSPDLVAMREDMLAGKRVSGCRRCYEQEEAGGVSVRQVTIADRGGIHKAVATSAREMTRPKLSWVQIEFGDRCSLKCRMCRPYHSTSIAADREHCDALFPSRNIDPEYAALSELPRKLRWYEDEAYCTSTLVDAVKDVDKVVIVGGEPLINQNFLSFLRALDVAGLASRMVISITTSASVRAGPWLQALRKFKFCQLNVSLDGVGQLNGYIRSGSNWKRIVTFLGEAKEAGCRIKVMTTLQAYNLFEIDRIADFVAANDLLWRASWLNAPSYLNAVAFPESVRAIFIDGLREQLDRAPNAECREAIANAITRLESGGNNTDHDWKRFIAYTDKLDQSRNEKLRDVVPRLAEFIERRA